MNQDTNIQEGNNLSDEIAAAEAELKAAQEKLDAVKAAAKEPNWVSSASSIPGESSNMPEAGAFTETPPPDPYGQAAAAEAPYYQQAAYVAPSTQAAQPAPGYGYQGNAAGTQNTQQAYGYQGQQPYYTTTDGNYYTNQQAYQQQYYQQPYVQPVVVTKDHIAAGLLAIFLGSLGIHKFYLGYNTAGFIMLAVTILGSLITFGLAGLVVGVIAIIEGIMYLVKSQSEFESEYVYNKREWF